MNNNSRNGNYSYKPSYFFKKGSIYGELLLKYNELFLKVSEEGIVSLSEKEKEDFFLGLEKVKKYIYGSFFYTVNEKYENKKARDKIIAAIYHRYKSFLGGEENVKEELSDSIMDIAEQSIFYSLGIEQYKKRNFKWKPEESYYGNFLKHTIKIPFSELIFLKMKEINHFLDLQKETSENFQNNEIEIAEADELIKSSGISEYIPEIIYQKIYNYLIGEIDYKDLNEADIKYLHKVYEGNNK